MCCSSLHRFLELPVEVRCQIYRYVVLSEDSQERPDPLGFERLWGCHPKRRGQDTVSLLLACQSVHAEAAQILYRESHFVFSDEPYILTALDGDTYGDCEIIGHEDSPMKIMGMPTFLRQIGPRNRANIRHLELELERGLCWLGNGTGREWVLTDSFKLLADARGHIKLVIRFLGSRETDFAFFYNIAKGLGDPVFRRHTAADTFELLKGAGELQFIPTSSGWFEDELYDKQDEYGDDTYKVVSPDEMQEVANSLVEYFRAKESHVSQGFNGSAPRNNSKTHHTAACRLYTDGKGRVGHDAVYELVDERQMLIDEREKALAQLRDLTTRLQRNQKSIDRARHVGRAVCATFDTL